jgi:hypothetical protein
MQKVTYRGPADKADRTTVYIATASSGKTYRLPVGEAVEVPDDLAKALADTDGHRFDGAKKATGSSSSSSTTPKTGGE